MVACCVQEVRQDTHSGPFSPRFLWLWGILDQSSLSSALSRSERVLLEIRNIDRWITKLTLITWDLHVCYTQLEFHIERSLQKFYPQKTVKQWRGTNVSVEEKDFCLYVNAQYTWGHCFSVLTVSSVMCRVNKLVNQFPDTSLPRERHYFLTSALSIGKSMITSHLYFTACEILGPFQTQELNMGFSTKQPKPAITQAHEGTKTLTDTEKSTLKKP